LAIAPLISLLLIGINLPPAVNSASPQSLLVTHGNTTISPPPSTRLIQKRKRAAHPKSSPAKKRNRPYVFTVQHETYIA
ncbi:MAG: hypothetical protein J3Q66DRAFT_351385, partial [Benniella sp.]